MAGHGFTDHHYGRRVGTILGSDGSAGAHGNTHGMEVAGTDGENFGTWVAGLRFVSFDAQNSCAANVSSAGRGFHSGSGIEAIEDLGEETGHLSIVAIVPVG